MMEKQESAEEQRPRLQKHLIQPEAIQLVPEATARKYNVIPLEVKGNVLQVAMANPADILALETLEAQSQMSIEPRAASAEEIREAIDFNYQSYKEIENQISAISLPSETTVEQITPDTTADAPIAKALTLIINEAIKARASDIHLQPEEDILRVRYRVDGTLHDTITLPLETSGPLISRIKILAKMNIADHNRPQDGQFSVKPEGRMEIDIRVGTIPNVRGEMVALRLLDKSKAIMTLGQLGFLPESLARYEESDASVLCKMSCQEGNEGSEVNNDEEWQAGNSRHVSILWHKNVSNWKGITWIKSLRFNTGWIFPLNNIQPIFIIKQHKAPSRIIC